MARCEVSHGEVAWKIEGKQILKVKGDTGMGQGKLKLIWHNEGQYGVQFNLWKTDRYQLFGDL